MQWIAVFGNDYIFAGAIVRTAVGMIPNPVIKTRALEATTTPERRCNGFQPQESHSTLK
jgi:hypothetical protein